MNTFHLSSVTCTFYGERDGDLVAMNLSKKKGRSKEGGTAVPHSFLDWFATLEVAEGKIER